MAMELDHSFTVPVPPDQAWDVLLDVERIAPCMPGATVDSVEGDDVAGRLKVKVGPVSLTYKGTAKFTDRDPDNRSVLVEASGKETRGSGTASATVRAALRPQESAESNGNGSSGAQTLVTLHTTLNVTGRPAQFGRGVIAEVGSRLIDKFADNLAQQLAGGAPAAAAAGPEAPAGASSSTAPSAPASAESASAAPAAAAPSAPSGARPAEPAERPAASAAPAPAATAPVRPPMRPAPAQDADDHLDLLSIVGPVIAKRLAPVLGALVGVALLTWIARRVFGRRK
jgi:uncharacterized protein